MLGTCPVPQQDPDRRCSPQARLAALRLLPLQLQRRLAPLHLLQLSIHVRHCTAWHSVAQHGTTHVAE